MLPPVHASLSTEQIGELYAAIETINQLLPFTTGLTLDQKQKLVIMDNQRLAFALTALEHMKNNDHLLPSYMPTPEVVEGDLQLFQQLAALQLRLAQLTERITDTKSIVGSQVMQTVLQFYGMARHGAEAGLGGADTVVADLRRFIKTGPKKKTSVAQSEGDKEERNSEL